MKPDHYLRVEGVNLGSFVFDTRDLSTVRGASLMLLDAVDTAKSALEDAAGKDKVGVLSRGASSGFFEIQTSVPGRVANAVRRALAKEFADATFVVDVAPISEDFRHDADVLLAANRWRQMQGGSLAVPPRTSGTMAKPACALDGVRPAENDERHGAPNRGEDKQAFISQPAYRRRNYGRDAKQKFYTKIIDRVAEREELRATSLTKLKAALPAFASDFASIAEKKGTRLDGKLAVFYADGNKFGAMQLVHCIDPGRQRAFDELLRSRREGFMTDFLETECVKDDWRVTWDGTEFIRFETLLWGGDEVMFVMPAALGWSFSKFFFEKLGGLNLKEAGAGLPDEPLSHAAALVFCQHHAPIHRIKRLLTDQMASFGKEATNRACDSLLVIALESFDHLGSGYEEAMKKRYRGVIDVKDTLLRGTNSLPLFTCLERIASGITGLRNSDSFARSQLRGLVRDIIGTGDSAKASERAKFRQKNGRWLPPREFRNAGDQEQSLLYQKLKPLFPNEVAMWIQLEELWDYALS